MSAGRRLWLLLGVLVSVHALAQDPAVLPDAPAPVEAPASTPAATPPVRSLDELLERVRSASARSSGEEHARAAAFLARRDRQQEILEAARAELAAARERAGTLEKTWEENDARVAASQLALRERLGELAQVFAELDAAGAALRERFRRSLTAAQVGDAREQSLDALLATAASGEQLPSIEAFDTLWYELQRELAESGRVRRFDATVADADGRQAGASVIRVGAFNTIDSDGRYLLYDPEARLLQALPRQPAGRAREDALALATGAAGDGLFALDPGGADDATALRAAAAAPTLAERLSEVGAPAWLALLLGLAGTGFALWRLVLLERAGGRGALAACTARLDALARERAGLDAIALEVAMDEAVLCELPALTQGLGALRAIGTLAPLLGALGTVVALSAGADAGIAAGGVAAAVAGDLAQALLSTALGLCAGIPVLALQALLATRAERLGQRLDEHAAALVTARACGSDA